ncbi:hypothetical protein Q5P01_025691 [Channa striata]|uniref:Ig-like domain-containing protein n=1 Tax=Channa striata TaxID=64152 RepID=A0AA88LHK5_CHASR|nr:hypothetical protein Q5P01_025691 [Channa striata]
MSRRMKPVHLILWNIVAEVAAAKFQSICPNTLVKSRAGDSVTLRCFLRPTFNVSAHTVEWKRADHNRVAHLYRHRKNDPDPQMGQYRNRTDLNREGLGRGVLDLQLSPVRLCDSGEYRCNVPRLGVSCVITLIVEERVQKNQTNDVDSRPSQPPRKDVTPPNNRGAEKMKAVAIVCGAIFAVGITLCLVVGLNSEAGEKCTEQLRGRSEPEPGVAADGSTVEMLEPGAGEGGENLDKPAENGIVPPDFKLPHFQPPISIKTPAALSSINTFAPLSQI